MDALRGDIKPEATFLGDPQGGITPEQQSRVRDLALEALRALREFRIRGVKTNLVFLETLLQHETFRTGKAHTRRLARFVCSCPARSTSAVE